MRILIKNRKTPSAIVDELKLSLPTVSIALRHLREIDLVRYENLKEGKVYSIKEMRSKRSWANSKRSSIV